MKVTKLKPVAGKKRAKCPDCGETFEYPIADKDLLFDEYGRFKIDSLGYVYKRYHKCKEQSSLGKFIKD